MSDKRHRRFQTVLCAIQIAFCTVMLLFAGLMVQTMAGLRSIDPGFDRDRVVMFRFDPMPQHLTSERNWSVQRRLLDGVRNIRGTQSAALAQRPLLHGIGSGLGNRVVFPNQRLDDAVTQNTSVNYVSPRYFETMGIRMIAGRDFEENDSEERKPKPVVVNEAFVRTVFGARNPIGQVFDTAKEFRSPLYQIVGVVSDTKYRSMRDSPPIYYESGFGARAFPNSFVLQVRTTGDPTRIIQPVRKLAQSIDAGMPIIQVATLAQEVDRSLWQERSVASVASLFSLFALLLAGIGLYGILACFVARRRREIGVRIALGAKRRDVMWFVSRVIMPAVTAGASVGGALFFVAGKWIDGLLYGVRISDLRSPGGALALLAVVAIAAIASPALRAMRLDPAFTLREE